MYGSEDGLGLGWSDLSWTVLFTARLGRVAQLCIPHPPRTRHTARPRSSHADGGGLGSREAREASSLCAVTPASFVLQHEPRRGVRITGEEVPSVLTSKDEREERTQANLSP